MKLVKLPEICNIRTGKKDANHATQSGAYRFYTCSNNYSMCDTYSFEGPCVIVPGNGDIGLVFYYDGQFEAYQRTYVLENIKINPKYLYYHFVYKWRYINSNKQFGSTVKYVRIGNFNNYDVPICSEEEQQNIVNRIEELFSELDKAEETLLKTKAQLEVYKQAVLSSSFANPNFIDISSAFDITGGLTKNSKRNQLNLKRPYLRVANVYYNRLDLSDVKEIGVFDYEENRTLLQRDDLLFVEGNGSKEQIGRVALWDGSIENCLHQNHIIKGRGNGKVLPMFALYYLMSRGGRNQILEVASSTSGLYTLSINKIKSLKIPYCPLNEQVCTVGQIENKLYICKDIENTIMKSLLQIKALRQSILKEAFEGKLV